MVFDFYSMTMETLNAAFEPQTFIMSSDKWILEAAGTF